MFQLLGKWLVALLAAPMVLCLASGMARAQSFDEPLEQCTKVTTPAALTTCAGSQDPLKGGGATINDQGDVTLTLFGAASNTTYTISFVSNDGTQTTSIGSIKTGPAGNGAFRKEAFFKFGTVGAGNVVLSNGGEQFVTGLNISNTGIEFRRDTQPGLVRCTDVTVPGTLTNCGSDSLASGHVDVEQDDGAVLIRVSGARPSTTYSAILLAPNGTSTTIGSVGPTNKAGGATLTVDPAFSANTFGSGEFVLQSSGTNEFVSGFKVDHKFVSPKVSGSNLVACGSVTNPILANCGSDPLDSGTYKVEAGGQLTVTLQGASPSTNYEAWFRPLDDSGDQDTGVAVSTNVSGNAKTGPKKSSVFASDTITAGTIVIKEQGLNSAEDQFVSGFETH
jgi:hypothetical protein